VIWPVVLGATAGWLGWTVRHRREPLLYIVPLALALSPFIWYASRSLGWPVGVVSTRVALVGCLALFVAHRVATGDFSWRELSSRRFVLPYLTLVIISVIWAVLGVAAGDVAALADEFVTWALPVSIFFALVASRHSEADLAVAGRALLVTVFVAGAVGLTQVLFFAGREDLIPGSMAQVARQVSDETWFGSFRVYGTFPTIGPNMFGTFLLIPTAIFVSRAAGAGKWRLVWAAGALVGVALIVASLSRGAQLGVIVALALLPFWRRSWRMGGALMALAAVGAIVTAESTASQRAVRLVSGAELDVGAVERLHIWQAILREAPGHPVGFGFNGWLRVSGRLVDVGILGGANTVGSSYPAENQWLRELADRGLLGVVTLAVLIGGLLIVSYRAVPLSGVGWQRDFMAGGGAGIAGFSVAMLTGDHLTYDSVAGMFWFIAALVASTAIAKTKGVPALEATAGGR
jgi:hypothetical protein